MHRRFVLRSLLAFGGLALATGCRDTADVIYAGGPVVTLEAGAPVAEALATRGERILGVGTRAEVEALAGRGTQRVDLAGHALLPGFVAVGGSFLAAGELGATTADLRSPPRGPVAGVLDLQQALVRFAAALPPDAWLVGAGYDDARLRERRQPTAADLDAVASDRPVVVLHATAPLAVANHFALALAGIEAATPDPAEGAIERDPATGEPTGVLRGTAVALVLAKRPAPSRHARLEIAVRAARVAASRGVTTALEGPADVAELERLLVADDAELLPVRVVLRQGAALARALAAGEVRVALRPGSRLTLGAAELDAGEAELGALAGELGGADTGVAAGARAAAERGLPFTLDGGALEPLRAVAAAVAAGLGVEPALRAVTLDAALALSLESERGSLAAGKLADLVILSQDPLAAPPEALADIEVLRTVVGGVPVYVE